MGVFCELLNINGCYYKGAGIGEVNMRNGFEKRSIYGEWVVRIDGLNLIHS